MRHLHLLGAAVGLLLLIGCEAKVDFHSSPASGTSATATTAALASTTDTSERPPATTKVVAGKALTVYGTYQGTDPISGMHHDQTRAATAYFLVARDGSVCRVHMVPQALAVIGGAYSCMWHQPPADL